MAEDDKYVPSGGNPKLDVASLWGPTLSRALDKQQADYEKNRDAGRAANLNKLNYHQSKGMAQDGLEYDSEGDLRSSGPNGYENSFDYQRKEQTKADRAHITERTWGKYNRGQTLDMYGKMQGAPRPVRATRKSQIATSISPDYGQIRLSNPTTASFMSPVAGGLSPWIGRFPSMVCGPMLVSTYGFSGGVIQSNAQEAINNGFCVNSISHWT
jgi:hypothetical protein